MDFGHRLKFDATTPAPPAGTKLVLCAERWFLSAETVEGQALREEAEKRRLCAAREEQERATAERYARLRTQAEETNAKLNIPVRWTSAQKSVLSGSSENSWGDGRNARSVNHVLLLEPLDEGKLKRKAHDFLCTSQPARTAGVSRRSTQAAAATRTDAKSRASPASSVWRPRCVGPMRASASNRSLFRSTSTFGETHYFGPMRCMGLFFMSGAFPIALASFQ